jgi:hypothetical protein
VLLIILLSLVIESCSIGGFTASVSKTTYLEPLINNQQLVNKSITCVNNKLNATWYSSESVIFCLDQSGKLLYINSAHEDIAIASGVLAVLLTLGADQL